MNLDEVLTAQEVLFAERPDRLALMRLRPTSHLTSAIVALHRNHGVEIALRPMEAYLAYAGLKPDWQVGAYDDSLSFVGADAGADVHIVWLDFDRYSFSGGTEELLQWLTGRLEALRARTKGSIVVCDWPRDDALAQEFDRRLHAWAEPVAGLVVAGLEERRVCLGEGFFDRRSALFTGTPLSDRAVIEGARLLGARIVPGLLRPAIKALAIDLDHTLYHGVLGEDGPAGLFLSEDHRALQSMLAALAERGVFLCCVSRNDPEDVARLFAERRDFPLQARHFADWQVGSGEKTAGIRRAADILRISTDCFLFLDDDPGELAAALRHLPEVGLICTADTALSVRTLRDQPRLWLQHAPGRTDAVRVQDAKANAARDRLNQEMIDPAEYVRCLGISLRLQMNPRGAMARLAEMSGKTNQFNLALRRLSERDVAQRLGDPQSRIVAVEMRDRLSDSGTIASLFGRKEGSELVIDDLCISCRALGRHVEDVIITEALAGMARSLGVRQVRFLFARGPLNSPALQWLDAYAGIANDESEEGSAVIPFDAEAPFPWRKDWNLDVRWSEV